MRYSPPHMLSLALLSTLLISVVHSAPNFPSHPSRDVSTYANVDTIVTTHFTLNLFVDFNNQSVYGTQTMTFQAK